MLLQFAYNMMWFVTASGPTSPDATLDLTGTASIFGANIDKSGVLVDNGCSGTQQAPSDGFLYGYATCSPDGEAHYYVYYHDTINPPPPPVAAISVDQAQGPWYNSFMIPIRKGGYWKICETDADSDCSMGGLWFMPIGK